MLAKESHDFVSHLTTPLTGMPEHVLAPGKASAGQKEN
jgi:hypothetical protein